MVIIGFEVICLDMKGISGVMGLFIIPLMDGDVIKELGDGIVDSLRFVVVIIFEIVVALAIAVSLVVE